jgi:hypothetical protein
MQIFRMVKAQTGFVLLACMVLLALQQPSARREYVPVFAKPSNTSEPRGTLQGDFDWAGRSSSLTEAAARWQEFIRSHYPANGEYEDDFEHSHVVAAQFELMRVYYLRGQAEKGDEILKKINPLGL